MTVTDVNDLLPPPELAFLQPDTSELASQLIALLSITVMMVLFGVKTFNVQYKYLTYSRWLVVYLYINSWLFTFAAIVLVTTNNGTSLLCFDFSGDLPC